MQGKYDLVKTSTDCKEGGPEAPQVKASTFEIKVSLLPVGARS